MLVLWVYGKTNAGKTTLGKALYDEFALPGIRVKHYDGDDFRKTINRWVGFSLDGRHQAVTNVANLVRWEMEKFDVQIVTMVTPLSKSREFIRVLLSPYVRFVLLDCDWRICKLRDKKDLYCRDAENVNVFERSNHWDHCLATDKMSVDECVAALRFHIIGREGYKCGK